MLLLAALVGLLVPNALFLDWMIHEYHGLRPVLADRLALSFMIDGVLVVILLTTYFARRPIGPVRWPWFVVLSFAGGLGFSIPFFYWWNTRNGAAASGRA
jgi:hypothetical protein